ncbi:xanthine dehydrogenase family Fe-S subunit [Orrella daihaiensis]|uniref:2Fe-2S iron-sulfur cluster binding domain-containing protein n=1 Tax=Orrella daihaiensis TaxID=2782176 RepID=A0ABY4AJ69_9BURK|nr:2Fe-2S iron-sulfur cluster-binding protein [Orrella daihaiensis]UOD50123.1 2Fe-2S iron-sulfur cluster binding domain-containing protein [Orrella daihaiensis]
MTDTSLADPQEGIHTKRHINLVVNGQEISETVTPRTHLGDFLREQLGLTGTHLGCEHGVCGACVVLLDNKPVRSCITYAASCNGRSITTIEGYTQDPVMALLRQAFTDHHALQCGYCTPGMLATARDIVLRLPEADERKVRAELSGNLCRCTGYMGIVNAVMSVLARLKLDHDPAIEALRAAQTQAQSSAGAASPKPIEIKRAVVSTTVNQTSDSKTTNTKSVAGSSAAPSGTSIQHKFKLPHPADAVWRLMTDLPRVAQCLPGAQVLEQNDEHVIGEVAIKFGPMSAKFEGQATLNLSPDKQQATLIGAGRDKLSNSRARAEVQYTIEALGPDESEIAIDMQYSLQGPLAQFSRSGLVQDFVQRMMASFADNVSHLLSDPNASAQLPHAAINPISMFFSILIMRIRNLFRKKD